MDKTLELIMVAVILIVASVVVLSLLQGQSETFGDFSRDQTNSSGCSLSERRYERALNCGGSSPPDAGAAQQIESQNSECNWAQANPDGTSYCP